MYDKYFPFEKYRQGQENSINEIIDAIINNNYEYVILDAGTGSGKSAVARTILDCVSEEFSWKSYLLTSTKMLQHQYYEESLVYNKFGVDYKTGKGRSNFPCKLDDNVSCNMGECKTTTDNKFHCKYGLREYDDVLGLILNNDDNPCYYWEQKKEALKSMVCILNYDVLLSDYPRHYKHRNLMVCDEAHNIDNKLMNRVSISLSESKLSDMGIFFQNEDYYKNNLNIDYWIERLTSIKEELTSNYYEDGYEIDGHWIYYSRAKKDEVNYLISKIKTRLKEIKHNKDIWFVDFVNDNFSKKIVIKPIDVHNYAKPYLLDKSTYHLLMSGSIVDYHNFSKYLGLDDDEVYYIQQDSSFDVVTNNPLIPCYCGKLTYGQKEKTLPKVYPIIEKIITNHMSEKGIIHCNSREFANSIVANCYDYGRFITYRTSKEKDEAITELKESENKIIVAYSLEEGLDLPNDDLRFQILLKCPFPSLADKQIKARMEADYSWYTIETIRKLIQTVGRGMRAEDDYCTNYLIDTSFKQLLRNKYCPRYLKDSVKHDVKIDMI